MKLNSYIIFDKQADKFNTPIFLENDAVAIRMVRNELLNPNSQISLSPQDYVIYKNAEFDDSTGHYHGEAELQLVMEVKDIQLPQVKEVK